MNVKNQIVTKDYAIYNDDCMNVLPQLPSESIDLSVYSPPFADLYIYSSDPSDFSNCENYQQFLEQYEYLVKEISRATKPGRITAVHCTDMANKQGSYDIDLANDIIQIHRRNGFEHKNRITIFKEPLKVRIRTMMRSLMHKFIVEDSTKCFTAMPDYLLVFKKKGENLVPVTHHQGLSYYAGETPLLPAMAKKYGSFEDMQKKYAGWKDQKTNKLSHVIWQRYASSVWEDIRINNVLKYKGGKDEDDEKHCHPLQLDVIDRVVELYSNPGETVLTPFMGVGSEIYSPVSMGRKAIGIELKDSYFKQAIVNLKDIKYRFHKQSELF